MGLSATESGFTASIANQKEDLKSMYIISINDMESELNDDCNNDSKFLWSDDEEIDAIIGDHTSGSFVENPAPSPVEVSCVST